MSRFVFLDRDGTLVRDVGYPHRLEDYELLPGVLEALGRLREAGFRLAIVTNQSGIGRALFTERDFERFQRRLLDDLARGGIRIERTYLCPHGPDQGCRCRKPEPELLWRARDELGATLEASWVIGDAERDVELARRAGCRGAVWVRGDPRSAAARDPRVRTAPDLVAAAETIVSLEAAGEQAPG